MMRMMVVMTKQDSQMSSGTPNIQPLLWSDSSQIYIFSPDFPSKPQTVSKLYTTIYKRTYSTSQRTAFNIL